MLFISGVGGTDVDHCIGARPSLLGKLEEPTGVVVDDIQLALTRPDIKVEVLVYLKLWPPDFGPRSAGYEIKHPVVVARLCEVANETLRLVQVDGPIVPIAYSCW